ncbi:hypothetical protein [Roseobacter ponti]|uniref:Uncharacterized protein n=1 Tax=Roseobacter ponti TaxID=1891787 RepID=A0A858SL76_9RHOB|nr:hypothetical protein [Roseobacter ponti]QJF49654.1 hypothetical protein G3256_10565 [Roseobacter ponti]
MTTPDDDVIKALDALLNEAAGEHVQLPGGLTARVLADARGVQTGREKAVAKPAPGGFFARLQAVMPGGWRGAGGLVAATCAGFWIGISPPAALPDPGGALFETGTVTNWDGPVDLAGFGWAVEEE